jgi:hypothetical protein
VQLRVAAVGRLAALVALVLPASACAPRPGARPSPITEESFVIADHNNTVTMRRYRIIVPTSHGWVATVRRGPRTDQVELTTRGGTLSAFLISAAWLPLSRHGAAQAAERTPPEMAELFFHGIAEPMMAGQGARDFRRSAETVGARQFQVLRWTTPGPSGEVKQTAAYAYAPLPRDNDGIYVFTYAEVRRQGADPDLSRQPDFESILTTLETFPADPTPAGKE